MKLQHKLGAVLCAPLFAALFLAGPTPAIAQATAPPAGHDHQCRHGMAPQGPGSARQAPTPLVQLEHAMQQEVGNDLAAITLFAEFKDRDAGAASQKATVAMNAALAKLSTDSAVADRRSQLQTWMDYGPDGKTVGWRARGDLILEGKDFAALGRAAARLAPEFAVAGISYRLSHEARQIEEQKLIARAIAAWRDKAGTIMAALGHQGHEPIDVQVRTSSANEGVIGPLSRMGAPMLMASSADGAAPAMESGKSRVSVTVSGSVRPR